jgi:hypothetical protein
MASYLSVDIGEVTITFESEHADLVSYLLRTPLDPRWLRKGWISDKNPSKQPVGFGVSFRYSRILADFHNFPFYYHSDWEAYRLRLRDRVSRDPEGYRFEAVSTGFEFDWTDLLLFTYILGNQPKDNLPLVEWPDRVDLEDAFYSVVRVVDGSSLYLRPLRRLSIKLDDIGIRLYGPESPDLRTDEGADSASVLDDLCRLDGAGRVWIAWERETEASKYQGYPRKVGGALIGHAFIESNADDYLYINGLTCLLHERLDRLDDKVVDHHGVASISAQDRPCSCRLLSGCPAPSDALRRIAALNPPLCLLRTERIPVLDPRPGHAWDHDKLTSLSIRERGCPYSGPMQQRLRDLERPLKSGQLSLFDLPLSMLKSWSTSRKAPSSRMLHATADEQGEGKDVFVIHTRSIRLQHFLVLGMRERLGVIGLKVWQYEDWTWNSPDGDIDRATLHKLLTKTPIVIVFDINERALTTGIREEVKILDNDFDTLFPLGNLAMISGSGAGYFAKAYPLRLGPVLELEENAEPSDEVLIRVCTFALRVAIRQDMLHRVIVEGNTAQSLGALDDWAMKAIAMIRRAVDLQGKDGDLERLRLVEELLTWFSTLSRKLPRHSPELQQRAPRLCHWIVGGFDGLVEHDRLNAHGTDALIEALDSIGDADTWVLEKIKEYPVYWEQASSDGFVFSRRAHRESTRVIARINGLSPFEYALALPVTDTDPETHFGSLVGLAETPDQKRIAGDFLLARLQADRNDDNMVIACTRALGDLREERATDLLAELITLDYVEKIRLTIALALIHIRGPNASAVIEEFILNSTALSRIVIASLAWKMDLASIYDLLLSLESDSRMRVNVLYSLERARNPQARQMVLENLESDSINLQQIAAACAGHLVDWIPGKDAYVREITPLLRTKLQSADETLKMAAVFSLIRAGQDDLTHDASEVLDRYLSQRKFSVARGLLVNAALGLTDWPEDRTVRALLYHSDPQIRGTVCFLVARQRRASFVSQLTNLQGDPSPVPPYGDGSLSALAPTVGENAKIALDRTSGLAALLAGWMRSIRRSGR